MSTNRSPASRPWASTMRVPAGSAKRQLFPALAGLEAKHGLLSRVADDQLADAVAVDVAQPHALVAADAAGEDRFAVELESRASGSCPRATACRRSARRRRVSSLRTIRLGRTVGVQHAEAGAAGRAATPLVADERNGKVAVDPLVASCGDQSRVCRTCSLPITTSMISVVVRDRAGARRCRRRRRCAAVVRPAGSCSAAPALRES